MLRAVSLGIFPLVVGYLLGYFLYRPHSRELKRHQEEARKGPRNPYETRGEARTTDWPGL
jgi:hypothetical protein